MGYKQIPVASGKNFEGSKSWKNLFYVSVKLVKIGFLNALDIKKINHWVHKKEPLHTEEDVVLSDESMYSMLYL